MFFKFGVKCLDVQFKEKGGFVDPKGLSRDIKSNEWGYERLVKVDSAVHFDDIMYLLRQAYETTL